MVQLKSIPLLILILLPQYEFNIINFFQEAGLIFLETYFPKTSKYGDLILKEIKGDKKVNELEKKILDRITSIRSNQEIISSTLAELKTGMEQLPNTLVFINNMDKINRDSTIVHRQREDIWAVSEIIKKRRKIDPDYKLDDVAKNKVSEAKQQAIDSWTSIFGHLSNSDDSILNKLIKNLSHNYQFLCKKKKSLSMYIFEMFEELKIVLGERTAISLLSNELLGYTTDDLGLENFQAQKFSEDLTKVFEVALKVAPRSVWTCNPDPISDPKSYVTLNNDIRLVPAPRVQEPRILGISWNATGDLEDYCDGPLNRSRKGSKSGYRNDAIKEEAISRDFDFKCNDGFLNKCDPTSINIDLCYAADTFWFERPDYCEKTSTPHKFENDEFCMCDCYKENHVINLNPVFSDVDHGKIITGAKLAERKFNSSHFELYIEIQQGELLENGRVDPTTVEWKENSLNTSADVVHLNSLTTEIYLFAQDLYDYEFENKGNISKVAILTGLQFAKEPRGIYLKIHGTPISFNPFTIYHDDKIDMSYFVSGKRENDAGKFHRFISKFDTTNPHIDDPRYEKYIFSDKYLNQRDKDRSELNEGFDKIDSDDYQSHTLFRPSSLAKDRGQNAVPYIELQKVETDPPTALTGAALYHKGKKGYGGYIALELRTI